MIPSPKSPPVPLPGTAATAKRKRTSEVLTEFVGCHAGERVSVGDLVGALGGRAFGALLLVFVAPNLPPLGIPGLSSVTALPILLLSIQMMAGRPAPILPRWLLARSVPAAPFAGAMGYVLPWLARVERLLKPRATALTGAIGSRVIGTVCFVLAVVLILPIPFGNLLPAIAIALLALGLVEHDGVATALGHFTAVISLVVVSGVLIALILAAEWIWKLL